MKKQIKEKITPLKKKQKDKKEYIVEYRSFYPKGSIFHDVFPEKYKLGWSEWEKYKSYKKEKDMLNFLNIVKKVKCISFCGTKYEYRIKK